MPGWLWWAIYLQGAIGNFWIFLESWSTIKCREFWIRTTLLVTFTLRLSVLYYGESLALAQKPALQLVSIQRCTTIWTGFYQESINKPFETIIPLKLDLNPSLISSQFNICYIRGSFNPSKTKSILTFIRQWKYISIIEITVNGFRLWVLRGAVKCSFQQLNYLNIVLQKKDMRDTTSSYNQRHRMDNVSILTEYKAVHNHSMTSEGYLLLWDGFRQIFFKEEKTQ